MKLIMAKQWNLNAATAKEIAKRIITGEEENRDGVRLIHIVDRLDIFATDALNKKYAQYGSQASIHTYWGGRQTIETHHTDGTYGHFDSNGNNNSTNNAMDIEVENYINNHLDENKQHNTMKNTKQIVRLTESDLHKIIKEAINELDWKTYMNAAKKRREQGKFDSAYDLCRASKEAFNEKYGYNDDDDYTTTIEPVLSGGLGGPIQDDTYLRRIHKYGKERDAEYGTPFRKAYYPNSNDGEYVSSDEFPEEIDTNARKELDNYKKGNYEYDNEKGWHLKDNLDESIRRAIRRRLR